MFEKKKCLKCGSTDLAVEKEGANKSLQRSTLNLFFPVRILTGAHKAPMPLYVCRSCGFSWESRN